VRAVGGVLDVWHAVAVRPATAQDRLVRVERLAVELRYRRMPQEWADVDADRLLVPLECRLLDVEEFEEWSMSWLTGTLVRGLRCSSTWLTRRRRIFSASAYAFGPAGTDSVR
jgi:hypothetical protein